MTLRRMAWTMIALAPLSARAEWVDGEIVRIDAPKKRVVLRHGPIRSVGMAAMTMPFHVDDAALLAPFRDGDPVRVDVIVRDDELYVTRIEKRGAPK